MLWRVMTQGITDIHTHVIFGVDDGAGTLEDSIAILKAEKEDDVTRIIASSHYRRNMFEAKLTDYLRNFEMVKQEAEKLGIELYTGCEYHANLDMVDGLNSKRHLTMADTNCVLTEFANGSEKSFIKERCYALLSNGYKPIIAHIERYQVTRKDVNLVKQLIDMGCYVQVNAQSVIGEDGFLVKQYCRKLLNEDLVHFIGSDAHDVASRHPAMGKCMEYLINKYGRDYAEWIMINNPQKLIFDRRKG